MDTTPEFPYLNLTAQDANTLAAQVRNTIVLSSNEVIIPTLGTILNMIHAKAAAGSNDLIFESDVEWYKVCPKEIESIIASQLYDMGYTFDINNHFQIRW